VKTFINLSNHASQQWSEPQRTAAEKYGVITDMQFTAVPPDADSAEVDSLVSEYLERLSQYDIGAVLLQGKFVFTYRLVSRLKEQGITVLSACSERRVTEQTDAEGRTHWVSEYEFVQFREY